MFIVGRNIILPAIATVIFNRLRNLFNEGLLL